MPLIPRKKWLRRHENAEPGAYRDYRRRYRDNRALDRWSPVAKGPLPPRIRRMFMDDAQQQAARWAKPRQRAITEYTDALARALAPISGRVEGYYGEAQQGQASSDAALSQMLSGQGQQLAGDLASQLAAAGQDTAGLTAGGVGQGAGGAAYAMGSANLGRLLAQGAAAESSAAQLPGIAQLGGLQHTRELQGQAQDRAQDFFRSSLDRELEKWISRTGLGMGKKEFKEGKRQFNVGVKEHRKDQAAIDRRAAASAAKDDVLTDTERREKHERILHKSRQQALREAATGLRVHGVSRDVMRRRLMRKLSGDLYWIKHEKRLRQIVNHILDAAGYGHTRGSTGSPPADPGDGSGGGSNL